ncbi:hypothetical protein [Flavobacterium pallidum]|nr:hypothetical protein [Flavobacterium pallidum]
MGFFWGMSMSVFQLIFEMNKTPIGEQLSDGWFYLAMLAQILVGTFVIGYFSWSEKIKKQ